MFTCPTKTILVPPENYERSELLWHDMTPTWIYIISKMMFLTNVILVHFLNIEGKMSIILRNKMHLPTFIVLLEK